MTIVTVSNVCKENIFNDLSNAQARNISASIKDYKALLLFQTIVKYRFDTITESVNYIKRRIQNLVL